MHQFIIDSDNSSNSNFIKVSKVDLANRGYLPYILAYKSNFLDVKMGSKNRPRLIFGRTGDIPTESQKNAKIHCNKPSYGVK